MAHGSHQHGEVLHTPGQDGANQNPKKTRRKSELRRQSRPHQRSGSRNGSEVMSEKNPSRRRHIIVAVWVSVGWSSAAIIKRKRFRSKKRTLIAVHHGVYPQRTQHISEMIHAT